MQGVEVYQNTGESMMEVYKDLWRSEEDRDSRQEFDLANENVRKLISKDDSGNKATKTDGILDVTIAQMFDRMKIPLGKILGDHGPYTPYGMFDFEYRITLPQSKKNFKSTGRRRQRRIQTHGFTFGIRNYRKRKFGERS